MQQVAQPIWNAIAQTQPLVTLMAQRLFPMNEDQIDQALEEESLKLAAAGTKDAIVRAAYLSIVLLLWENLALSEYQQRTPEGAIGSLPNINSVNQALLMSSADYSMTTSQQNQLRKLLEIAPL